MWGDGSVSSSDGQRFGLQASSLLGSLYPRYFGYYDQALTVYTHTSDQHSVFHTQVISCSVREAIYVLDGLLNNDTVLRPKEHFVDQHGFTDQLFGLCHLLGFTLMPRLNVSKQTLYKLDRTKSYGVLDDVITGHDRYGTDSGTVGSTGARRCLASQPDSTRPCGVAALGQ